MGFPCGSVVKNLPSKQERGVWFLDWEDLLEKEMATHFSILASEIPWTEEPGRLQSMGSQKSQIWLQFSSVTQLCPTLCDPMNHSMLGLPVHHQLRSPPIPMSIVSVMPSNHLILYRPLLLLPSIFPSIRVFSNESALRIRWPKYWSFRLDLETK